MYLFLDQVWNFYLKRHPSSKPLSHHIRHEEYFLRIETISLDLEFITIHSAYPSTNHNKNPPHTSQRFVANFSKIIDRNSKQNWSFQKICWSGKEHIYFWDYFIEIVLMNKH